ncbi:hypothetical protein [Methanocalculus sp.]|uniref:hypothetical protein n=1 Tax=Methanocalculus sp. TaxID=2004547 RepID=UPI00263921F6|nr:hypothetical protein [Methanocalculus sp.]MDG6250225.1 hypothetical protein [Methanocalculus sp.]
MAKRLHPIIRRRSDLSIVLILLIYAILLFISDFTVVAGLGEQFTGGRGRREQFRN